MTTSNPTYFEELLQYGVPETLPKEGFTFEDLFDEFVAGSQKTWKHDRSASVGASEAFGCIRKSWFGKRGKDFGFTKDPEYHESWGAVRRGDLLENYHVVPAVRSGLKRRGLELIMEGENQDTIIDGVSSATLDGLIIDPTGAKLPKDFLAFYGIPEIDEDSVVLEMKSFDPRIAIAQEKAIHRGQTQMQMGLIRETSKYKPRYAVVLYVNASWIDDIRPFVVEYDESVYQIGRARARKVFEIDDPAMLGAEGKLDGMCDYCPFQRACAEVSVKRVPASRKALTKKEIEAQDNSLVEEISDLAVELRDLKLQKKELERKIEEHNEGIRQKLIMANESRAVGQGWKASYTVVAGRKTLSKAKMEEAGLNPEDFMEEGAGYEKLTVTFDNVPD
ncbi:exonuclease [Rhodobacter phage RcXuper]|nr:exonuclease [Rhodobacter phage RcXuper]